MSRHEFLAELHGLIQPEVYFEIGVQYGDSLNLAGPNTLAIGVDPLPQCSPKGAQVIFGVTSKEYFEINAGPNGHLQVDLAFIDGSHLIEDVILDFESLHPYMTRKGVLVFDDVLPYSQEIADRLPPDGDGEWTGDAWKIEPWLRHHYPSLSMTLVDTFPTGLLLCWNLVHHKRLRPLFEMPGNAVPASVLQRHHAVSADVALSWVAEFLA